MAFPPQFLEELRTRTPLGGLIGKKVRLVRKGRELVGLCPFHNEKSPSFTVNEEKQFFHCFGCGAHGDAIGFVMQSENVSFVEACEQLAGAAGLAVPQPSPQARAEVERQTTLLGALDAACRFFEGVLRSGDGQAGLRYLQGRGLDDATIGRFRLGFAPAGRARLLQRLGADFPETLLAEAGLIRRNEAGETYDYFRDRVIFPIADRAGRIIAFGGRTLGDGQPKYLNSPDTPVFEKGRVLYGFHLARAARATEPSAIVTEGYMDVIALHRAGFSTAVAPLGTALTENQLELLWQLAPEPVLCFDGDMAGTRAASRAIGRALPLLKPGRSLKLATLPQGQDPDSLVASQGAAAMESVLASAIPLVQAVWRQELAAKPVDTPERRADLASRLDAATARIADRAVAREYGQALRELRFQHFRPPLRPAGRGQPRAGARGWRDEPRDIPGLVRPDAARMLGRRQREILVAAFLVHPALLHELVESFAEVDLADSDLEAVRNALFGYYADVEVLDVEALQRHLCESECRATVAELLRLTNQSSARGHAEFLDPTTDLATARDGWLHTRSLQEQKKLDEEVKTAGEAFARAMTAENFEILRRLQERLARFVISGDE